MHRFPAFLAILLSFLAFSTPSVAILRVDINAGTNEPMTIAVPAFALPEPVYHKGKILPRAGKNVADVISADLRNTGLFGTINPKAFTTNVTYPDVISPQFSSWRTVAAQALVTGFVQSNADGTWLVGCYLYDVFLQTEIARKGFVTSPQNWRRAAHRCTDMVYQKITGDTGYFDTRIVYVSETGPQKKRIKRLAIMDQDGANHRFLTSGYNLVLTPRFAANRQRIAYLSFAGRQPWIHIFDLKRGQEEAVLKAKGLTFAPRFSPSGENLLLSMTENRRTNIHRYNIASKKMTRLTNGASISTSPSYSPDGKYITFESDKSGTQQVYVMNADGSNSRRISFGKGRYATPLWSPRGDYIAFTKISEGKLRIGVIRPDGTGERLLTNSWADEGPAWSPNGRILLFFRTYPSRKGKPGKVALFSVDISGLNERKVKTPLDGSDPAWSPLLSGSLK